MSSSMSRWTLALIAVAVLTTVSEAQISGVRVDHVSSELINGFDRAASMTIDGSGLNINGANTHSGVPDGTMWLNTGTCCGGISYVSPLTNTDPAPRIGYDLGALYDLSSVSIWNYNESVPNLTSRGIDQANILVSSDNINYTNPFGGAVALNQAPGADNVDFSQLLNFPAGTQGRFVRIDALSSHGGDNGFFGLSEVQFDGTLASAPPQTLITGVTATASSELAVGPFDRQAQYAVDGSGFNAVTGTHSNVPDGTMWLTTGNGAAGGVADPNPQITFDLGAVENVGKVEIWNYNESAAAFLTSRGIQDMTVETSLDGMSYTEVGDAELVAAGGATNDDFHQTLMLNTEAQFVRFSDLTNYGDTNNFIGLSEVQFFSQPTAAVPEPASFAIWSLVGLGLASIVCLRFGMKKRGFNLT